MLWGGRAILGNADPLPLEIKVLLVFLTWDGWDVLQGPG